MPYHYDRIDPSFYDEEPLWMTAGLHRAPPDFSYEDEVRASQPAPGFVPSLYEEGPQAWGGEPYFPHEMAANEYIPGLRTAPPSFPGGARNIVPSYEAETIGPGGVLPTFMGNTGLEPSLSPLNYDPHYRRVLEGPLPEEMAASPWEHFRNRIPSALEVEPWDRYGEYMQGRTPRPDISQRYIGEGIPYDPLEGPPGRVPRGAGASWTRDPSVPRAMSVTGGELVPSDWRGIIKNEMSGFFPPGEFAEGPPVDTGRRGYPSLAKERAAIARENRQRGKDRRKTLAIQKRLDKDRAREESAIKEARRAKLLGDLRRRKEAIANRLRQEDRRLRQRPPAGPIFR